MNALMSNSEDWRKDRQLLMPDKRICIKMRPGKAFAGKFISAIVLLIKIDFVFRRLDSKFTKFPRGQSLKNFESISGRIAGLHRFSTLAKAERPLRALFTNRFTGSIRSM
jgi:hypothetical protein